MKKVKLLALMFLAGATIFTSCKKDETTVADPTISFQGGTTSLVFTGANSVDVNVTFAAEGEIETVSLNSPSLTSNSTSATDITSKMGTSGTDNSKGQTSATYLFKVTSTDLAAAFVYHTTLTYTFTVTDKNATSTTGTFTVTQNSGTSFTLTKTGQFYHVAGSLKGAYDLDGDAEVSSSGVASTKSMKNTDLAGNAFTGSWSSDAANGTQYVKDNAYDYTNATVESATSAFAAGSASTTVTNPAVNDIYIAKKSSTYYVIKITALDPADNTCACGNKGKISFSYKKN